MNLVRCIILGYIIHVIIKRINALVRIMSVSTTIRMIMIKIRIRMRIIRKIRLEIRCKEHKGILYHFVFYNSINNDDDG